MGLSASSLVAFPRAYVGLQRNVLLGRHIATVLGQQAPSAGLRRGPPPAPLWPTSNKAVVYVYTGRGNYIRAIVRRCPKRLVPSARHYASLPGS